MSNDFLLGLIIGAAGIPILAGILGVLDTLWEWIKSLMALPLVKRNAEITQISEGLIDTDARTIGFDAPWREEYDEEEIDRK